MLFAYYVSEWWFSTLPLVSLHYIGELGKKRGAREPCTRLRMEQIALVL
jgi:hypothetical protein